MVKVVIEDLPDEQPSLTDTEYSATLCEDAVGGEVLELVSSCSKLRRNKIKSGKSFETTLAKDRSSCRLQRSCSFKRFVMSVPSHSNIFRIIKSVVNSQRQVCMLCVH